MTSISNDEGGKRVKSVQRAFRIIDVLRDTHGMKIAEVAETLNLPISTAHVHLKTLESVGYVVNDENGYRLGLRFLRDGITVRESRSIYHVGRSEIDELAEATSEVANLGVEEGGMRVILYQAEGSDAVYDNASIGEYANMHCTALGKAMLAMQPRTYVELVLDRYGLPRMTDSTVTTPDALFAELTEIVERGYALEDEERRVGIRSLAVPIGVNDELVGALSLSGPKKRFNDGRIQDELLPALQSAKNVIEVKYTYE